MHEKPEGKTNIDSGLSHKAGQRVVRLIAPAEEIFGPDRLQQIIDNSLYTVGLRLRNGKTALVHRANAKERNSQQLGQVETSIIELLTDPYENPTKAERDLEKAFAAASATEVVTRQSAANLFGERADGMSIIQYKTLVRHHDNYPYEAFGDKRRGQYFCYDIVLPDDEAMEVWAAFQQNPELAREFGRLMTTSPDVADAYEIYKDNPYGQKVTEDVWQRLVMPPYGEWERLNGGQSVMAFRTNPAHGPDIATLVAY